MREEQKIFTIRQNSIETNSQGISELLNFFRWANNFANTKVTFNLSPVNHVDAMIMHHF